MTKTLFISDIHLEATNTRLTHQFLTLLDQLETTVDALYILGDLFEYWIGDDDCSPFHQTIKTALREVTQQKKIPVYFIHGNRDFLIGARFFNETGCILLSEETKIILYGTPILLMHGDTLCREDRAYLRARKLLHNRLLQALFLHLPLGLRQALANKIRAKSRQYTEATPPAIMNVTEEAVKMVMRKHDVRVLIHGHTHRPYIHEVLLGDSIAKRIVLGSWHEGVQVITWDRSLLIPSDRNA